MASQDLCQRGGGGFQLWSTVAQRLEGGSSNFAELNKKN